MNDGVEWRVVSPKATLSKDAVPVYENMILMTFDLMYAALIEDDPVNADIERLIPSDPVFRSVDNQSIFVQNLSSGMHEYFPVSRVTIIRSKTNVYYCLNFFTLVLM